MAKLTRSNVAHDLNISPHKLKISYSQDDVTYVFSSEYNLNRFVAKAAEHRKQINQSLSNRFNINIKNDLLSDLKLYTIVEKRGFLIYKGTDKIGCLNEVELRGQTIKTKS